MIGFDPCSETAFQPALFWPNALKGPGKSGHPSHDHCLTWTFFTGLRNVSRADHVSDFPPDPPPWRSDTGARTPREALIVALSGIPKGDLSLLRFLNRAWAFKC